MILRNLRLAGEPVDLRIENGLIAEVGRGLGAGHDFEGRWVVPGLWDNHVHFTQWALTSQSVDLSGATSAREAAALMVGGGADLVVGANFRDALWADTPTREVLDATTGGTPAVLVSADLHSVWLNSAALRRFGHPDHPSGLLSEDYAFAVHEHLATMPDETVDGWARGAAAAAAARGVVGIVDLEMAWNLDTWQRRIASGHDSLRVEFGIYTQHLDRAIGMGLRSGDRLDDLLTVGPYKVLTDGSLNTRTAFTRDAYDDGTHGLLTVPPETLVPLLRRASDAGLIPAVHAIGDHANTLALDAFGRLGIHGRIEHAQLLDPADLSRFAALGVAASVQPEHAMDDRDVADRYWPTRTGDLYPFRSLLDAGATLLLGSDAPVAPLDPWIAISAAVTRERGGRSSWHPEQRITFDEALRASTRSTIAAGQPADLAITEKNPRAADGEQLRQMPIHHTLLGGRVTYSAD